MGDLEVLPPRQVVVSALPVRRREVPVLAQQLGGDFRLVEIRNAPDDADVVLCPPCSPQLVARLRRMFPSARVIAVELHDIEGGLHVDGPVGRILAAGAEGYLLASSGQSIAQFLAASRSHDAAAARAHQLTASATEDLLIEQLDALARRRAAAV